jgi:hypothetical protein
MTPQDFALAALIIVVIVVVVYAIMCGLVAVAAALIRGVINDWL